MWIDYLLFKKFSSTQPIQNRKLYSHVFLYHTLVYILSSIYPQQHVGRDNTLTSIAHPLISTKKRVKLSL
jgi:hypothetical protein